jgi:hypothetical protein
MIGERRDALFSLDHGLATMFEDLHGSPDTDRYHESDDEDWYGPAQQRLCAQQTPIGWIGNRFSQPFDRIGP